MGLSDKYDEFYSPSPERERFEDIDPRAYPRNRVQAVVYVEGRGKTILDIGCGNGTLLFQFRNRYETLIGLEYSKSRIAEAIHNLSGLRFRPIIGSAENMEEIETDSIDRIVTADVVEHIPDVYAAMKEMHRVLRPGGDLVINTPNIAYIKRRAQLLIGRFPSTSQPNEGLGSDVLFDGGHLHYFTFRSLRLLIEMSGLQVVKSIGYGKLGRVHGLWPALLSVGAQWIARKPSAKS
jgi:SAM-dependent methyltransferase